MVSSRSVFSIVLAVIRRWRTIPQIKRIITQTRLTIICFKQSAGESCGSERVDLREEIIIPMDLSNHIVVHKCVLLKPIGL